MNFSTSFTDKFISICLYSGLLLVTVWAGSKAINHTIDRLFVVHFVTGWEQVVTTLNAKEVKLPKVTVKRLVADMDKITQLAQKHSITLPSTNTKYPYAHVLKKLNQPEQHIFITVQEDRLIIYGLGKITAEAIDKQIDTTLDLKAGRFTAHQGKNQEIYIGLLSL